jgi:hypothetical protein
VAREPKPIDPPALLQEFDPVTNLGIQDIIVDGRILKRVQLFECRNLHE